MNYYVIQLIGFAGTVVYFFSFQFKSNKALFRAQFLSYLIYTIHLCLLGAVTGGISYMINTLRSLCLGSRFSWAKSPWMCALLCVLQLATLALTWNGWLSLLPVTANIASTLAGYTFHARKIRLVTMLVNSPLWIIYNAMVGSLAGILDEVVSEASVIVSFVRYGWKNLDFVEK